MKPSAIESEPEFLLRIRVPAPLTASQVLALRSVDPARGAGRPASEHLAELRAHASVTLGPYAIRRAAEQARLVLEQAGLDVEIMLTRDKHGQA